MEHFKHNMHHIGADMRARSTNLVLMRQKEPQKRLHSLPFDAQYIIIRSDRI